ncbi:MAG: hypothetical protein GY861_25025 [bacterium]|nr:hypothetical protein [bacterium]
MKTLFKYIIKTTVYSVILSTIAYVLFSIICTAQLMFDGSTSLVERGNIDFDSCFEILIYPTGVVGLIVIAVVVVSILCERSVITINKIIKWAWE